MDDAEAIARSVDDPTEFGVVYDRYADDVHRFVLRRLGADLADDITAETFATALRHRARYDPARPNARPWLFGIAANLVGKHRRSEVRGLRAVARLGADPVAAHLGAGRGRGAGGRLLREARAGGRPGQARAGRPARAAPGRLGRPDVRRGGRGTRPPPRHRPVPPAPGAAGGPPLARPTTPPPTLTCERSRHGRDDPAPRVPLLRTRRRTRRGARARPGRAPRLAPAAPSSGSRSPPPSPSRGAGSRRRSSSPASPSAATVLGHAAQSLLEADPGPTPARTSGSTPLLRVGGATTADGTDSEPTPWASWVAHGRRRVRRDQPRDPPARRPAPVTSPRRSAPRAVVRRRTLAFPRTRGRPAGPARRPAVHLRRERPRPTGTSTRSPMPHAETSARQPSTVARLYQRSRHHPGRGRRRRRCARPRRPTGAVGHLQRRHLAGPGGRPVGAAARPATSRSSASGGRPGRDYHDRRDRSGHGQKGTVWYQYARLRDRPRRPRGRDAPSRRRPRPPASPAARCDRSAWRGRRPTSPARRAPPAGSGSG